MFRALLRLMLWCWLVVGATIFAATIALADGPAKGSGNGQHGGQHNGQWPGYQRRGSDWGWRGNDHRRDNFDRRPMPQSSSSWFQRPYPYHLDYYKMKWGGSYAPYFGNLYGTPFGTPQVVGNSGWGVGPWGWGVDGYGFGSVGVGGPPTGFPGVPYSYSMMPEFPTEQSMPANGQTIVEQQTDGNLPAAKQ